MIPVRTAIVSFILLSILLSPSFAQPPSSLPEPDKDLFVGTWKANADRSRPKLDEVEGSYVRTVSREGDDVVFSSRIKKPHSVGFAENRYKLHCDGSLHRVQCGSAFCKKSCLYVTATRVEGETVEPDGTTLYWADEVSSDGQEIRIYSYNDKARKKLKSIEVADRVK